MATIDYDNTLFYSRNRQKVSRGVVYGFGKHNCWLPASVEDMAHKTSTSIFFIYATLTGTHDNVYTLLRILQIFWLVHLFMPRIKAPT